MPADAAARRPISLAEPPTGAQIVELWRSTEARFPTSRRRIRRARDIANKDPQTIWDPEGFTLPQRLMAVTLTNSFASQYGTPELTRYGRPVATDQSDEIETVMKATLEKLISTVDLFGKAAQDAEWGVAVLPADADWAHVPVYSEEDYALDAKGKQPDETGYGGRDGSASRRAHGKDMEDFLAQQDYVTIDLIDPTDCAPILIKGRHGRRFEARGLVVKRLFDREALLAMGYRCAALTEEKATLIPRGDRANGRGSGGQLWLYTAYLTLWDEDGDELVPCVVYSVAGETTDRYNGATETTGPAVINLRDEYGISTPMWGYYWGLQTADPDPDLMGLPFMDAYASLVISLERMLAASVHHAERSSFRGSWVEPGLNVPPEAYTETIENQLVLKRYDPPESGELVTAPGRVTPDAPPPLGPAASQMMSAMLAQLEMTAPDVSNPAGKGASGHAMSLASGLLEAAHGDIPRGVLACYEDLACWVLECLCAVMRTFDVPYVLDANEELPPEAPGGRRYVSQRYVLTEKQIGTAYKLSATWRQKPDPTAITLTMDRALKGYASVADVLEAAGETNTTWKIAEILYYRAVMTPGTPENLELTAYVARKRGEQEKADQLALQAKKLVAPQGTPTDAIAPEAQQMAQQVAQQGGMGAQPMPTGPGGQPSGVQTGVQSSIAATVQGAVGRGPMTADAMRAAQMGVRPATPAPMGGPGAAGGPV